MERIFLDLPGLAMNTGMSEGILRGMILQGKIDAYVFYCGDMDGTQQEGEFLPSWTEAEFPDVQWRDQGSPFDVTGSYDHGTSRFSGTFQRPSNPAYWVKGWIRPSDGFVARVLTRGEGDLNNEWVALDGESGTLHVLKCRAERRFSAEIEGYEDVPNLVREGNLMFRPLGKAAAASPQVSLDKRREKSLLRVIRALDVMAKLPDRGAANSVQAQMGILGFNGPNDETIRGIIEEARALKPDKPQ